MVVLGACATPALGLARARMQTGGGEGFLLIGREIYWVPVRVTYDLKPHIVGVFA